MQKIGRLRRTLCVLAILALPSLSFAETRLVVSPSNPRQLSNSALQFTATLNRKDVTRKVQWRSSSSGVATIAPGGLATLLAPGTTTITAVHGGVRASTTLTVTVAASLVFTNQPTDTSVSAVIDGGTGGVKVQLLDNLGGPLPSQSLAISLGDDPPGTGTLSGTLSQTTDSTGTATFPDLKIDWLGNGYFLQATANPSSGALSAFSAIFNELGVGNSCLWGGSVIQTCGLITPCTDTDGDGLPDAWETAGGLDLKGDGTIASVLTGVDPVFPDGSLNPTPSADVNVKDVFVKYDWMELADQLTNGQPTACTLNTLYPPYNLLLPHHSDACDFDQLCLPPQGSGATCDSSTDGCTCQGHSDEPTATALQMVVDAYAARGMRLHLVKGQAVPHANVTFYGAAPAACTQEFSSYSFSGAQVVNYFDIKTAYFNASFNSQFFDEQHLSPAFHYALFAHRHTCDSVNDCNNTFCDPTQPSFNETGRSELPGNDLIVSLGGIFDRTAAYLPDTGQGGTFMHELGHNLGLNHGGPLNVNGNPTDPNQVALNYKPNFISVMNYNFQTIGISSADPNCSPDDMVCRTTPVGTRLDYSSFCPLGQILCDPGSQVIPNTLDETNGSESAGINIGNNGISYIWSPGQTGIPATGPVDFNGDGNKTDTWCPSGCTFTAVDLNNDGDGKDTLLQPFEDWPNLLYQFACTANYSTDRVIKNLRTRHLQKFTRELTSDEILGKHLLYPPNIP